MAWRELTDETVEKPENQQGALPGAQDFSIPVAQDPELGELGLSLFEEAKGAIQSDPDPRFARLRFGPKDRSGTGEETPPTAQPQWRELEALPSIPQQTAPEEEKGFFNNTGRVMGQRALGLVGSGLRFAGEVGADVNEKVGAGQFVWGDGEGFRYVNQDDFAELKAQGVTENLLTETLPMAFQDRDLGGAKRHTVENIKLAWASGDVSDIGSAVGKYIAETGFESVPDMIAAVWAMPMYIGARSQEIAEERVRNERLSESLAADISGYVQTDDLDSGDLIKAAPFAALSALLERIGAKGIGNAGSELAEQAAKEVTEAGVRAVLKEGGKAATKEAATEFFQEGVIEYVGERLDTSQDGVFANLDVAEGAERGAWAALAGGGAGGVGGATVAAGRALMTSVPETDIDPETGKPVIRDDAGPDDTGGGQADFEDTSEDGMSQAEKEALLGQLDQLEESDAGSAQGELDVSEPPAPPPETATTPIAETAPDATVPEPTVVPPVQKDEVVTESDLVTEPEAASVESPMIQRGMLEEQFAELASKTKKGMPGIRKAVRELGTAIAAVFPTTKSLPSLKGTIGPARIADYFATLDEEIKIDEVLPNLKGFLEEVVNSPDAATAVQNINRLKDYVATSGANVADTGTIAPSLQDSVKGITLYDTFEADRKSGTKKYNTKGKDGNTVARTTNRSANNKPQARAVAIDELATVVKSLLQQASELGIDVSSDVNDAIARARNYRESSQVVTTTVSKGGAGSKKTNYKFNRKNLDEVGGILREAAQSLVEQIAAVDTSATSKPSIKTKKAKAKPKAKARTPVTKAPAKAKKAEAAKKVSKAKTEKKLTKKKKESARVKAEIKKGQADLAAGVKAPTTVTRKSNMADVFKKPDEIAHEEGIAKDLTSLLEQAAQVEAQGGIESEAGGKASFDTAGMVNSGTLTATDMSNAKMPQLRMLARAVGAKPAASKSATIERIQKASKAEVNRVNAVFDTMAKENAKPKKRKKPNRIANPDKVIEVATPAISGRQKNKVEAELGESMETAGISPKAAATIKALIKKATSEGQTKIIAALKSYTGPEDNLKLVTTIEQALKGKVPNAQMMEVLQFAESMAGNRTTLGEPDAVTAEADLAEEAAAQGLSLEDYKTILQDTGQYVEDVDPEVQRGSDEFFDMSADEYANSDYMKEGSLPQGAAQSNADLFRALINAKTGLLGFLSTFTKHRGLPNPGPTNTNDLLKAIIKSLPANHRYVPLAKRLLKLGLDVPVYIYGERMSGDKNDTVGSYYPGNEYDPNDRKIKLFIDNEQTDPRHIFATSLHEIVHAATVAAYDTDVNFRNEINMLFDRAQLELQREGRENSVFYGMTNGKEFIAEAMTNPEFQQWLAGIDSTQSLVSRKRRNINATGLMRRFINSIKKYLGYSIRNSLLEDVVLLTEANLQTDREVVIVQERQATQLARWNQRVGTDRRIDGASPAQPVARKAARTEAGNAMNGVGKAVTGSIKNGAQRSKSTGKNVNLAFSGRDAIERENRSLFNHAAEKLGIKNPLAAYDSAKNLAQTLVRSYEKKAYNILKSFSKMPNYVRSLSESMMLDITMANIDPTQPLNSVANAHIWTNPTQTPKPRQKKDGTWYSPKAKKPQIRKQFKDRAIKARDNWLKFSKKYPVAAKSLKQMAALTKLIHDTKIEYALTALGEAFEFDQSVINDLGKAKTIADIETIIPTNEVEQLTAQLDAKDDLIGLTKEEVKNLKRKISLAESRAVAAESAKTILTESSVKGWYFPLRRYGQYVASTGPDVTGSDRYVSFHETQAEAELARDKYNATASDANQVSVSLKLEASTTRGSVSNVMSDLTRRIKDPETRARLNGAMAEVLAANASYESQLKRENIDGVATKDMARAFEEYVHVSKYSLGDIRMAHTVSEAISGINRIAANRGDETGMSTDEVIQAGRVQNEIAKRNKSEGGDRKKNSASKVIGLVGFLNFLGAPSYWALNATQTYVVTIPYFSAKYGELKGPAALARSQKMIFGAVFKAMKSGDKSYDGFKAQLPPATQRLVTAMERDNLLQSTIAHEFGDMLNPNGFKRMREHALTAPVAKFATFSLMLMERIPEAIEHYNRISTGIAAYELSNGDYLAVKDAVNETQMNYDTNNRARLLKSLPGDTAGTTTPYVTPMMMFKTFGVGMAKLFYGAAFDVAFKKGGRVEALKLGGYLMATHTLFAGVAGGLMVAPVAIIQAALNAALDPDDEWDLEDAAYAAGQELQGDFLATMMERGLPAAALGVDMSKSINLANLLWMGNERLDYREYGDLQEGAFQLFGPVAQYAAGAYREGARLITGDTRAGVSDFLQAMVPIKVVGGMLEAIEYSTEGMRTGSDLTLLQPENFSSFITTMLGFQSTQKAETSDAYYSGTRLDTRRAARKSQLMVRANRALMSSDKQALASIFEDIQAYNLSVPSYKYRIHGGTLSQLRQSKRKAQREYDKKYRYAN